MKFNFQISPSWRWSKRGLTGLLAATRAWWRQLPRDWRSPIWPVAAGLVTALILLVSFHQVVSGVVEQAALRRQIAVAQLDDDHHCDLLHDERAHARCLMLVGAPSARTATPRLHDVGRGEQIATR